MQYEHIRNVGVVNMKKTSVAKEFEKITLADSSKIT